jgi:hypothetical protein
MGITNKFFESVAKFKYLELQQIISTLNLGNAYGLDDREFDSRKELEILHFTTASRPALGPTQPPIQWVSVTLSLVVKRPRREADHSPPSNAEVKNAWSYTSTPQYAFMAWCSVKAIIHIIIFDLSISYLET